MKNFETLVDFEMADGGYTIVGLLESPDVFDLNEGLTTVFDLLATSTLGVTTLVDFVNAATEGDAVEAHFVGALGPGLDTAVATDFGLLATTVVLGVALILLFSCFVVTTGFGGCSPPISVVKNNAVETSTLLSAIFLVATAAMP